jgi:hypothetical protein
MKFTDNIATFFIGVFCHRAAVYNANIRLFGWSYTNKSPLLKLTGKGRALREVEFATKRMKTYSAHRLLYKKSPRRYKKWMKVLKVWAKSDKKVYFYAPI